MNRVAMGLAALAAATRCAVPAAAARARVERQPGVPTGTASTSARSPGCTPSTLADRLRGQHHDRRRPAGLPAVVQRQQDPINGNGFESAVDLAIAKELGYTSSQIKVKRVTFTQAIGPAPRNFDFDLDEFSITPKRETAVDFSAPYYNVAEADRCHEGQQGGIGDDVRGSADAQARCADRQHEPADDQRRDQAARSRAFFGGNALAVQALKNGQIDGLVVDLPTAFYITAAQVKSSVIVGQLPQHGHPGAVRRAAGEGQPAHYLREQGGRRADGGRHVRADPGQVAGAGGRRARPPVTPA